MADGGLDLDELEGILNDEEPTAAPALSQTAAPAIQPVIPPATASKDAAAAAAAVPAQPAAAAQTAAAPGRAPVVQQQPTMVAPSPVGNMMLRKLVMSSVGLMKKVCLKGHERPLDDLLVEYLAAPSTKVRSAAALQRMKEIAGLAATRDWERLHGLLSKHRAELQKKVRVNLSPRRPRRAARSPPLLLPLSLSLSLSVSLRLSPSLPSLRSSLLAASEKKAEGVLGAESR